MSSQSASSQAQALARRKMRKGTHSCAECRRRKIRCIFTRNDPNSCVECHTRGLPCEEQVPQDPVPGENRHNLRERVGKLESMMEALLRERQSYDKSNRGSEEQDRIAAEAAEALHHLRSYSPDSAGSPGGASFPIYEGNARFVSLFDNAVLTRQRDGESYHSSNPSSPNNSAMDHASPSAGPHRERNRRNRRALLEMLPETGELNKLLEDSNQWLQTWRKMITELGGCKPEMSLQQFVKWGIAQEDINIVANALLAVGLAVQQRPSNADSMRINLPLPPKKLLLHYLHVLESLNIPDDECAASPEGIELIMVRAKIYDNLGMVRKGWLMFRRACALIQMMGYHSTRPNFPGETQDSIDKRNHIWCKLSFIDRWISMILGLPYTLGDEPQPLEYLVKLGRTAKFRRRLTIVVGKVINQSQSDAPPSIESTLQIDQELNDLASGMPLDWWDKKISMQSGTWDPSEAMEKSAIQMWYHQSKAYLHLPFMLQSASDERYEYSRLACLEASRRIIGIYQDIRSQDRPFFIGRIFDFQGFIAGMFLLLGLLGYSKVAATTRSTEEFQAQEELDWHLIDRLLNLMRHLTRQDPDNSISSQSLAILETLSRFGRDENAGGGLNRDASLKVAVPFFGTIHLHAPHSPLSSRSASSQSAPIPVSERAPSAAPAHVKAEIYDLGLSPYAQQRVKQSQERQGSFRSSLSSTPSSNSRQPQHIDAMSMDAATAGTGGAAAAWPQIDINFETWVNMDLDQDWNWFLDGQVVAPDGSMQQFDPASLQQNFMAQQPMIPQQQQMRQQQQHHQAAHPPQPVQQMQGMYGQQWNT